MTMQTWKRAWRAAGLLVATLFTITLFGACQVYPEHWAHTFVTLGKDINPNPTIEEKLSAGWKIAAAVSPLGSSNGIGYYFTQPVDIPEGIYPTAWEHSLVTLGKTINPLPTIDEKEALGFELAATVEPMGSSNSVGYLFQRPTATIEHYPSEWEHTVVFFAKSVNAIVALNNMGLEGWELTAAVSGIGSSNNVGYFLKRPVTGPSEYPLRWEHTFFLRAKSSNADVDITTKEADGWELMAATGPLGESSEVGYFFKRPLPEEEE